MWSAVAKLCTLEWVGKRGWKMESTRRRMKYVLIYGKCSRIGWCQMDRGFRTHEWSSVKFRSTDRANCPRMEENMRSTRPREVHNAEWYYETTREYSGQEVAWESLTRIRRGTARLQKRMRDYWWDLLTKATSREEIGEARKHGSRFCDLEKVVDTVQRKMAMATQRYMGLILEWT